MASRFWQSSYSVVFNNDREKAPSPGAKGKKKNIHRDGGDVAYGTRAAGENADRGLEKLRRSTLLRPYRGGCQVSADGGAALETRSSVDANSARGSWSEGSC